MAESFFHTLKTELIHHEDFQAREEAQQAIFEYIEVLQSLGKELDQWLRGTVQV